MPKILKKFISFVLNYTKPLKSEKTVYVQPHNEQLPETNEGSSREANTHDIQLIGEYF